MKSKVIALILILAFIMFPGCSNNNPSNISKGEVKELQAQIDDLNERLESTISNQSKLVDATKGIAELVGRNAQNIGKLTDIVNEIKQVNYL